MNINALIKFSSRYPEGKISQATFEYLSSMAHLEADHNARIAFLSERGARVASEPSQYWQRAFSALKFASQEGFLSDTTSTILDIMSESAPAFKGDASALVRLAYANPSLRPLILKVADDPHSQSALRQQGVVRKRVQNRAPVGEGKKTTRLENRAEKKTTKKQELTFLVSEYENAEPTQRTAITKKIESMIRGKESTRENKPLLNILTKWGLYESGEKKIKSPKTGKMVTWKTLHGDSTTKEFAEEFRDKNYHKRLVALAKRVIAQAGDGSKKKEDGAPKSEGAKAEGASESTTKSDSGGGEPTWEDTGLDANTIKEMKAEGKTPGEAAAMVYGQGEGQGEGQGDENEPKEETPETPTDGGGAQDAAQQLNLGETGNPPKAQGKKPPTQMGQMLLRNLQQNMSGSRPKRQKKKASEGEFSFSDFDSDTDFDIVF